MACTIDSDFGSIARRQCLRCVCIWYALSKLWQELGCGSYPSSEGKIIINRCPLGGGKTMNQNNKYLLFPESHQNHTHKKHWISLETLETLKKKHMAALNAQHTAGHFRRGFSFFFLCFFSFLLSLFVCMFLFLS